MAGTGGMLYMKLVEGAVSTRLPSMPTASITKPLRFKLKDDSLRSRMNVRLVKSKV